MAGAQAASFAVIMVPALCVFIVGDAVRSNFSLLTQGAIHKESGLRAVVVGRHRLERVGEGNPPSNQPPSNRDESWKTKKKLHIAPNRDEQLLIEWQSGYYDGERSKVALGSSDLIEQEEEVMRLRFEAWQDGFGASREWQEGHVGSESEEEFKSGRLKSWQPGYGAEWQSGYGATEWAAEAHRQRFDGYWASRRKDGPMDLLHIVELRLKEICNRYGDKVTVDDRDDERQQYASRNAEYAEQLALWKELKKNQMA